MGGHKRYRVLRPAPKPQEFSSMSIDDAWGGIESAQRIEMMMFCLDGIMSGKYIHRDEKIGNQELQLVYRRFKMWLKYNKTYLRENLLGQDHPPRWLFEALREADMLIAADEFKKQRRKEFLSV